MTQGSRRGIVSGAGGQVLEMQAVVRVSPPTGLVTGGVLGGPHGEQEFGLSGCAKSSGVPPRHAAACRVTAMQAAMPAPQDGRTLLLERQESP